MISCSAPPALFFAFALFLAVPAWAQSDDVIDVTIEGEQPLGDALQTFADQADLQVIFFADVTDGKVANGVEGSFAPDVALDTLLADTGLTYTFLNDTAVSVQEEDKRGDSDSKNSEIAPVLMAQNQTSQAQTASGQSNDGTTSVVIGKVTDARTGANLKGAKVTIEETAQWTSTNELGQFRFVSVPTGNATLTVSYLGYAGQSAVIGIRGVPVAQNFALRAGSKIEEIIVLGQRSARPIALNQERTAENSLTVVSADLLGNFNGTTISDALRRTPGIATIRNGATGDGTNIIIRGLEPALNEVTLNGVRLPDTSGVGRATDLSGLLADSVSKITVNTTLLPSQDSAGTGALVEVETRSPLDRPRRYLDVGLEGTFRDEDFGKDYLATATASGRFGKAENFGLSASIQYRDQDVSSASYSLIAPVTSAGEYWPLQADGSPILDVSGLDPLSSFPFEAGASNVYPSSADMNFVDVESSTLTATLTSDWEISSNARLRIDYVRTERETDVLSRTLFLLQAFEHEALPVPGLSDEIRGVLTLAPSFLAPDAFFVASSHTASADLDQRDVVDALSLNGDIFWNEWEVTYGAGYTKGERSNPQSFSLTSGINFSFEDPGAFGDLFSIAEDELASGAFSSATGVPVSIFGPRTGRGFPVLQLTADGLAEISNTDIGLNRINRTSRSGKNDLVTFDFSARRYFAASWVDYIEVGGQFEETEFSNAPGAFTTRYQGEVTTIFDPFFAQSYPGFNNLGVGFGVDPISPGLQQPLTTFNANELLSLFRSIDSFVDQSFASSEDWSNANLAPGSINSYNSFNALSITRESSTQERSIDPYLQTKLVFGDWEIVGGVRVSSTETETTFVSSPTFRRFDPVTGESEEDLEFAERFTRTEQLSETQTEVLPRVAINFRPRDNTVIRGNYYRTIARPDVGDLNTQQIIDYNERPIFDLPNGELGPRLRVSSGNPDLKPAITDNYEVSAEYYTQNAGAFKLRIFYKETENLLELNRRVQQSDPALLSTIVLPEYDDLLTSIEAAGDDLVVEVNQPVNSGDSAEIFGAEFVAEYQFSFLPGWYSGIGIYGNYTYTDSEKTFVAIPDFSDEEFSVRGAYALQSPHTYTVGATYDYAGIGASLFYTYQSETDVFGFYGLPLNNAELDSLDFRVEYTIPMQNSRVRLFLEGSDLLRGSDEADVESFIGANTYTDGFYRGGRFWTLGAKASF